MDPVDAGPVRLAAGWEWGAGFHKRRFPGAALSDLPAPMVGIVI